MSTDTAQEYIDAIAQALRASSGARDLYFPRSKAGRIDGVKRLAREVGHGLASYPDKEVEKIIGSTYSTLVVKHCFDSTGVPIPASEFFSVIRRQRTA